jgi:peptidoglycan/LPS O-acetylase OafA/YrhL
MESSRARLPYRPDIDGLRAVAVASVIAYHARPALLPGGFVGVDVFFVISGYLITQLILHGLQQGSFTLAGFYRRVRRIVPPLLVVLTACCLFGWFVLLPGEFSWLGKQLLWCTPFFANVFLRCSERQRFVITMRKWSPSARKSGQPARCRSIRHSVWYHR